MRIRLADGSDGDRVIDVRMVRGEVRGHLPELIVDGFVVGRTRPGMRFGYDRNAQHGPWILQQLLGKLPRHTGYLRWSDVDSVDWDERIVHAKVNQVDQLPR
jgi:hypothetical protein